MNNLSLENVTKNLMVNYPNHMKNNLFAAYLTSVFRVNNFAILSTDNLEERLSQVHHADLENFRFYLKEQV